MFPPKLHIFTLWVGKTGWLEGELLMIHSISDCLKAQIKPKVGSFWWLPVARIQQQSSPGQGIKLVALKKAHLIFELAVWHKQFYFHQDSKHAIHATIAYRTFTLDIDSLHWRWHSTTWSAKQCDPGLGVVGTCQQDLIGMIVHNLHGNLHCDVSTVWVLKPHGNFTSQEPTQQSWFWDVYPHIFSGHIATCRVITLHNQKAMIVLPGNLWETNVVAWKKTP